MTEEIFAVVYLSQATVQFGESDVQKLAHYAAQKNEDGGVSGYLCFKHGLFVQYLEGKKSTILTLLHQIRDDYRHHMVSEITLGDLSERHFLGWDMRYLDRQELKDVHLEEVLDWIIEELQQERVQENGALEPIRKMVATIQQLRANHTIA